MNRTMAALVVMARWLVAASASALVFGGVVQASVWLAVETPARSLASPTIWANDAALNARGEGIYKHLWLDAIGPDVYVPHVDTGVHQSR